MSTRWESYCNTSTDLIAIDPLIDTYDTKRVIEGFTHGSDSLYTKADAGYISALFRDGVSLGAAQANAVAVNTDGEWYYDATTDLLTICTTANPDTVHRFQAGVSWVNVKTEAVSRASEFVRAYLNKPILRRTGTGVQGESARDWDDVIIMATAYLACSYLIEPYDREKAAALRLRAYNSEFGVGKFESGLLDQIKRGDIALWNEITRSYTIGTPREVAMNVDSTGTIVDTAGTASTAFDLIKIIITVAGTFTEGSASTIKFSVYTGDSTGLKTVLAQSGTTITGGYQYTAHGIYVRFSAGKYNISDEWEIEVRGGQPEAGVKVRETLLVRI